jgi:hypothetical protein
LDNNVHGNVHGSPKPADLAQLFAEAGWRVRRSSWTDYEVEHTWVSIEFVEDSGGSVLFAGVIDPAKAAQLSRIFDDLGLASSVELELR